MSRESVNSLATVTGKDRRTIVRRLAGLPRGPDGKYDSRLALPLIYRPDDPQELERAQAALYSARADLTELKAKELRMRLIPTADAQREWERVKAVSTARLRQAAADMAEAVRGVREPGIAKERMTEVLHVALDELSETAN